MGRAHTYKTDTWDTLGPILGPAAEKWYKIEKVFMINMMGCDSGRHNSRLRTLDRILTLAEIRETGMTSLHRRVVKREEVERTAAANGDLIQLINAKRLPRTREAWDNTEMRQKKR